LDAALSSSLEGSNFMFREAESLIQEGLQLPEDERLRIAERLYESVPEEKITSAWLDEVERRKAAWDAGVVQGIDGDDVIRGLRERARK
jgi:putative addiction module component (TIGR02574 family)